MRGVRILTSCAKFKTKNLKQVMAKKTLDEGFTTFLSWLLPLQTEYDKGASHKTSVENCLINKFKCYRFFETGSFGSGTGVRHYSDSDFFAVIPNEELWDDSSYTLTKIKEGIRATFSTTTCIKVDCPSVKIPFGTYKSEDMEITPCSFGGIIETPLGKFSAYEIADCNSSWMLSSPDAHNKYVKQQDDRLGNKLKNLIRFVKAWKYYNNVPISSFYLELRCTKWAESESAIVYNIDLSSFLKHLQKISLASIQDPMGISGYISASKTDIQKKDALSKLNTAVTRAEKAQDAKSKNDIDNAFYWWDMLFNNEFPNR